MKQMTGETGAYGALPLPLAQRLRQGQFDTPARICDLMVSLVQVTGSDRVLEPGCGAAPFLNRALERMMTVSGIPPESCIQQLYGIELDPVSVQWAQAQFGAQIHAMDFLSADADALDLFDVIIGNPPYIRHEHVKQSDRMDKQASYTVLLSKYEDYLAAYPEQKILFSQTADLYLWFFLQAATLLKPGGRLAFITSNSWLNASFGQAFQRFLQHRFHVRWIVESACERWFPDAAVNAVILVLEKKLESSNDVAPEPVRLLRFHQSLSDWFADLPEEPSRYWQALDKKVQRMCHVEPASDGAELRLLPEKRFYANSRWAFQLRSPQWLSELLENRDAHVALNDVGNVRYPLKTGINPFFYVTQMQIDSWNIEPEFLHPVVKSARQLSTYSVRFEDCTQWLFSCPHTIQELRAMGKHGAADYIAWGETQSAPPRQKRAQPVPWPEVASVQSNRPWHYVRVLETVPILCSRFLDRRFFFPWCRDAVMEDQTFYGLTLFQPEHEALVAALLNSTLSFALLELMARTNLGEGVLQYARGDMADFPVINPTLYTECEREKIELCFSAMAERPVLPVVDEVACEDRNALDRLILTPWLKTLACSEDVDGFRARLVEALLRRMDERIIMARSLRKNKTR